MNYPYLNNTSASLWLNCKFDIIKLFRTSAIGVDFDSDKILFTVFNSNGLGSSAFYIYINTCLFSPLLLDYMYF